MKKNALVLSLVLFTSKMHCGDIPAAYLAIGKSTDLEPTEQSAIVEPKCKDKTKSSFEDLCKNFHSRVDLLCWQASEDGLEYGTKMIATPLIGSASTTSTEVLDIDFTWDPGFSLGFGYLFSHFDCWTIQSNWTHIRNRASSTTFADGTESQVGDVNTIISPWVNLLFELRAGASKAKALWHVNYNTLDLDFGKIVLLSKRFSINPYFGLRGAWIDQQYKASYDSVFILAEGATPFTRQVTFLAQNDFRGFGLQAGAELLCHISQHWYLFSQVSGSIVYGRFGVEMKNLNDQGLGEGSIPPMPLNFIAREHFWRARFNFEEAVGFGWQRFFMCNKYRLSLRAAYELVQWPSQNQLFYTFYFRGQDAISSVPIRSQGDLSFQGTRLTLQFDF